MTWAGIKHTEYLFYARARGQVVAIVRQEIFGNSRRFHTSVSGLLSTPWQSRMNLPYSNGEVNGQEMKTLQQEGGQY